MATPVRSRADVLERLHHAEPQIRELGVRRLALFGSFAREESHAESDVDLLVEFDPAQKTFDHFFALAELTEELLGRRVELVTTEALSPYIGPHILAEAEDVVRAA
jgi:predicted nucleotidyltransferase